MRSRKPTFDDDELVVPVPLSREEREWLAARARDTGRHPSEIASQIIRDVIEDDRIAHERTH